MLAHLKSCVTDSVTFVPLLFKWVYFPLFFPFKAFEWTCSPRAKTRSDNVTFQKTKDCIFFVDVGGVVYLTYLRYLLVFYTITVNLSVHCPYIGISNSITNWSLYQPTEEFKASFKARHATLLYTQSSIYQMHYFFFVVHLIFSALKSS